MTDNYSHPNLTCWLSIYIKLRGICHFQYLPELTPDMTKIAHRQDLIPWISFVEGKLSEEIMLLQGQHLVCLSSKLTTTVSSWAKKVVSEILQIYHAQWVFKNVSLMTRGKAVFGDHLKAKSFLAKTNSKTRF